MKKLFSLFIVTILLLLVTTGCTQSQKKPASSNSVEEIPKIVDNEYTSYTPEKFEYIAFGLIPEGYTISTGSKLGEEVRTGKDWNENSYIKYFIQFENSNGFTIQVSYFYSDDGREHGVYIWNDEDASEYLSFIRNSSNNYWSIYELDMDSYSSFNPYGAGIEIVMFPTDKTILGYIKFTTICHNDDLSEEMYNALKNDALAIADGVSESSLDRNAFNELVYS